MIQNSLARIINLINDPVPEIRKNTYYTIINFSENLGFNHILKQNTIEMLVDKLNEERDKNILPLTL